MLVYPKIAREAVDSVSACSDYNRSFKPQLRFSFFVVSCRSMDVQHKIQPVLRRA